MVDVGNGDLGSFLVRRSATMNSSASESVYSGFLRSTPLTQYPLCLRYVTRWCPMNPPAPVTTTRSIASPPVYSLIPPKTGTTCCAPWPQRVVSLFGHLATTLGGVEYGGSEGAKGVEAVATLGAGPRSSDSHIRGVPVDKDQNRPISLYERFAQAGVRPGRLVSASRASGAGDGRGGHAGAIPRWLSGLYAQWRVGRGGEMFKIYKFRTMIPDRRGESQSFHGPDRRLVHKSPDDPRVVPFGRTLRKFSLG